MRQLGLGTSLFAAAVLAVVPCVPARAGIAPAQPIAPAAAGPGADDAHLVADLVRSGMSPEEARTFVAGLGADERAFMAERAEKAQSGGIIFLLPAILLIGGIAVAVAAIIHVFRPAPSEEESGKSVAPPPAPEPAREGLSRATTSSARWSARAPAARSPSTWASLSAAGTSTPGSEGAWRSMTSGRGCGPASHPWRSLACRRSHTGSSTSRS